MNGHTASLGGSTGQFFTLWADLRSSIVSSPSIGLTDRIGELEQLAGNARERTLIAAIEIQLGARNGDGRLRDSGLNRLEGASAAEILETLDALTDLAILGPVEVRKRILLPAIRHVFEPDDAGLAFVEDPGLADAALITSGRWSPPAELGVTIGREVRLWVAWSALDAWLHYRRSAYRDVISSSPVAFRPNEPGAWEHTAIDAVARLSTGEVDEASSIVQRLSLTTTLPTWAQRSLSRTMSRYCPLAGSTVGRWGQLAPTGLVDPAEARNGFEELAFSFPSLIDPGLKRPARSVGRLAGDLSDHPWITFCLFVATPHEAVRQKAAEALLGSVKRPDDVRSWPWPSRSKYFAAACLALQDRRQAVDLIARGVVGVGEQSLREACVQILRAARPQELVSIHQTPLAESLKGEFAQLEQGIQAMLKRRGVFRAVIDGSNVAWAGRSRSAGAKPSLRYVEQVLSALAKNGFKECLLFFDASLRYQLGEAEGAKVERLQAEGRATIVRGAADPHIIDCFLEDPEHSWIVTTDEYREWVSQKPGFRPWWPEAKVGFFVGQDDRIRWERELSPCLEESVT